jgi:hypothetical protein
MLLAALISEAQYKLLKKGESSPFDSAVAVQIKTYRLEGQLIKQQKALSDSLISEINGLYSEIRILNEINANNLAVSHAVSERLLQKDAECADCMKLLVEVQAKAAKPPNWYLRKETWAIAALILGVIVSR